MRVLARDRHWSLSWVTWLETRPSHTILLRPILILYSQLCLCSSSSLFHLEFLTKSLMHYFSPTCRLVLHVPPIPSFLLLRNANYEALLCTVLCVLLLFRLSYARKLSSSNFPKHPQPTKITSFLDVRPYDLVELHIFRMKLPPSSSV